MFSKFNHGNQAFQITNTPNQLPDNNNNLSTIPQNGVKTILGPHQNSTNVQNVNCEIRNMEEEEDDVDSLNINFDDVNDHSDMEEYYNNCAEQAINSNNNNINNGIMNSCNTLNARVENCLYENQQHFIFNPKVISSQVSPNKTVNRMSQCAYENNSVSSSPSIIESNILNELNPIETGFGISNTHKANNKNVHCVKEKIRRDRIKMSCNQLRKLIPNVDGFKTDMASLLETSVYWAELINSCVPEQYLSIIKARLSTIATLKMNGQFKSLQNITGNSNLINQKYKQNFDYLLSKNHQEKVKSEIHNTQNNSPLSSLSSSLTMNQFESLPIDINHSFNSLPALNLKPNSWLPYSFQLNNETNNCINIAQSNVAHHHHPYHVMAYNDYYDKNIKKSPSNSSFTYER